MVVGRLLYLLLCYDSMILFFGETGRVGFDRRAYVSLHGKKRPRIKGKEGGERFVFKFYKTLCL